MALGTQAGALGSGSFGALPDPIATLTKDIKPKAALGPTPPAGDDLDRQLSKAAEQVGKLKLAKESEEAYTQKELAGAEERLSAEEARQIREDPFRAQMQAAVKERKDTTFVPTKENVQDIGGLFTLTNLLGFMIGGKSKGSAQQAMSAMNGMLEGHQKGREDLYKQQKDLYEVHMKALDKTIDNLSKEYQDAINLYARDRTAGLAAARNVVAKHNADFIKDAQEKYGLAYAYDKIKDAVRIRDQAKEKEEKLKSQEEERKFRRDLLLKKEAAKLPTQEHLRDLEDAAQAIANYAEAPPSIRDKERYQILARVRQINPAYMESDYGNRTKSLLHWKDPQFKGAQSVASFITVASHLEAIDKLSTALNNKNSRAANAAINHIKTEMGYAQATNFNTAKEAVSAEIVRAIEGGPGGVADRDAARDLLSSANSPQQLKQSIDIIKDLIKRRLETSQLQYEQSTGRKDFINLYPKKVQEYMDIKKTAAEAYGETSSQPTEKATPQRQQQLRTFATQSLSDVDNLDISPEEKEERRSSILDRYRDLTGEDY